MKNVYYTGDRPEDLNQGKETIESEHYLLIPAKVSGQNDKKCLKDVEKKISPTKNPKTNPKILSTDSYSLYKNHAFTSIRLLWASPR